MSDKKFMSYKKHVIYYNDCVFMVALKRDGTDEYFATYKDAMKAIDEYEEKKGK